MDKVDYKVERKDKKVWDYMRNNELCGWLVGDYAYYKKFSYGSSYVKEVKCCACHDRHHICSCYDRIAKEKKEPIQKEEPTDEVQKALDVFWESVNE